MSETAGSRRAVRLHAVRVTGFGIAEIGDITTAHSVFQLFNPDGTFGGTQKISQNLRLNAGGDRWDDNATFQIVDANDIVVATGCATAVGTRFE